MNEHVDIFALVPEIDFDSGYHYYLGNFDNYCRAILSTLKSIKSKLPLLRIMVETREYEGLRMITQTLRRMMVSIGGVSVAESCYQLEVSFLNQEDTFVNSLTEFLLDLENLASRMEELIKMLGIQHHKSPIEIQDSYFKYDLAKTRESIRLSADFIEKKII